MLYHDGKIGRRHKAPRVPRLRVLEEIGPTLGPHERGAQEVHPYAGSELGPHLGCVNASDICISMSASTPPDVCVEDIALITHTRICFPLPIWRAASLMLKFSNHYLPWAAKLRGCCSLRFLRLNS